MKCAFVPLAIVMSTFSLAASSALATFPEKRCGQTSQFSGDRQLSQAARSFSSAIDRHGQTDCRFEELHQRRVFPRQWIANAQELHHGAGPGSSFEARSEAEDLGGPNGLAF